jgi:hypothetical protein
MDSNNMGAQLEVTLEMFEEWYLQNIDGITAIGANKEVIHRKNRLIKSLSRDYDDSPRERGVQEASISGTTAVMGSIDSKMEALERNIEARLAHHEQEMNAKLDEIIAAIASLNP